VVAYLVLLLSVIACAPAFAGPAAPSAPEIDPGSLAALTSGITAAYVAHRVYRSRKNKHQQ
jgi:hypothetical protein